MSPPGDTQTPTNSDVPGSAVAVKHARRGVTLAYIAVHEIFQMAIAAHEMGELRSLHCSLFDADGKWGRKLRRLAAIPSAAPLGSEVLPAGLVHEMPFPLLARQAWTRIRKGRRTDPLPMNQWFERLAASRLNKQEPAKIAVAAETCALRWFEAAKERDMRCVLDSHGIPAQFLDASVRKAADEFSLPHPPDSDSPAMASHKMAERELADVIVLCSELQKRILLELGEPGHKLRVAPLWVDTTFWKPAPHRPAREGPLRVAFVGSATLAKGVPYLLQAVEKLAGDVSLTIVGSIAGNIRHLVAALAPDATLLPYMSREALRDFYATQHLVVMPSLGDSFGFVSMEAMACGLPVIVTEHCGAPVPSSAWRVPAHDAEAIAARLRHYLNSPAEIEADSQAAVEFARQFPPAQYRRRVKAIYEELFAA